MAVSEHRGCADCRRVARQFPPETVRISAARDTDVDAPTYMGTPLGSRSHLHIWATPVWRFAAEEAQGEDIKPWHAKVGGPRGQQTIPAAGNLFRKNLGMQGGHIVALAR